MRRSTPHQRLTNKLTTMLSIVMLVVGLASCKKAAYKPASSALFTTWGSQVNSECPLPEYPRPQLQRTEWLNLNGLWHYRIDSVKFKPVLGLTEKSSWTTHPVPGQWQGKILVPFAVDAPLSGVGHILRPDEIIWYERSFSLPRKWKEQQILLHFEASDWETSVYINGEKVGQHRGGYDPFCFDITEHLTKGKNMIQVCVWDATETQAQAIGKQVLPDDRQGYRYQHTGGIGKTVWIEPVPKSYIQNLQITPEYDNAAVTIKPRIKGRKGKICYQITDNKKLVAKGWSLSDESISIPLNDFKPWAPNTPNLYDIKVSLHHDDKLTDQVQSYFGMRKIKLKKDSLGFTRIHLNNKEIFQYGPLDQGYWPDGVLTPPSEEAILFDLNYLKQINCNMVRVHIKKQPNRWYYHADRLGLLVWQDMVCMPKYGQEVDENAAKQWYTEIKAMINSLYNHPSIINWILFNEGWSQHNTDFYASWLKQYDTTRLVTAASGWTDAAAGDIMDVHDYTFYPRVNAADFKLNGRRALAIGEAGGTNLPVVGHTWYSEENLPQKKAHMNFRLADNWNLRIEAGRQTYSNSENYLTAYRQFIESIKWLKNAGGNCALVYTQITDVEHELNGWMTYDRKVSKIKVDTMARIHGELYADFQAIPILPFGSNWSYKIAQWDDNYLQPETDFTTWKDEAVLFVDPQNTVDITNPIIYTTEFEITEIPANAALGIKGVNACKIFINGYFMVHSKFAPRTNEPGIDFFPLLGEDIRVLKKGKNRIIVYSEPKKNSSFSDVAFYIQQK